LSCSFIRSAVRCFTLDFSCYASYVRITVRHVTCGVNDELNGVDLKLIEVARIFSGYQTRGRLRFLETGDYVLIQTKDIDDLHLAKIESCDRIEPDVNPSPYNIVDGDILFQARGAAHYASYIGSAPRNTLCTNAFMVIRADVSNVDPGYLAWWLNQSEARNFYLSHVRGSNVPFIPKSIIEQIPVCLPDLATQRRIAELARLWDRERILRQELLDRETLLMIIHFKKIESELLNAR